MEISAFRKIQRENFTDWNSLCNFLELGEIEQPNTSFPLNLPKRLAVKIEKGNIQDPILRQFLPSDKELISSPLFLLDPVGDKASCRTPKFLHKYHGRALLLCSGACAMHCRYCFRQHFDYETKDKEFDAELKIIANDPSLSEIILSGGDPLSLSNARLKDLLQKLGSIPHIKRIRFHTRFPMGIPERIDEEFLTLLALSPKQIFFVLHCNHPREFDEEIFAALKKIQKLGIPLLTQTVLLKDVNDDVQTLHDLFMLLVDHGILPYYLNQLDRVQGSEHFDVSEERGLELIQRLRKRLPGYGMPAYVREIAGEMYKVPLNLTSSPKS